MLRERSGVLPRQGTGHLCTRARRCDPRDGTHRNWRHDQRCAARVCSGSGSAAAVRRAEGADGSPTSAGSCSRHTLWADFADGTPYAVGLAKCSRLASAHASLSLSATWAGDDSCAWAALWRSKQLPSRCEAEARFENRNG